jgi:hypothetical protein
VLDDWSAVSNPIQTRDATPARGKVGVLLVAETPKLSLPAAKKQKLSRARWCQRLTKYRIAATTTIKTTMPTIPIPPRAAIIGPPSRTQVYSDEGALNRFIFNGRNTRV